MFNFKMKFYVTITPDGLYHVQNYIGGYRGQHHVHSKHGFDNWVNIAEINKDDLVIAKGMCCCKLKAGDIREFDGYLWHNERFK